MPFVPFEKGNKLGGRKKGSLNKKTKERTEKLRQYLEDTNVLEKMVMRVITANDMDEIKVSDAIKAFDVLSKYFIKTTSQDQDDVVIEELTRSDAEQKAEQFKQRLDKLLPKTMEEEE